MKHIYDYRDFQIEIVSKLKEETVFEDSYILLYVIQGSIHVKLPDRSVLLQRGAKAAKQRVLRMGS